MPDLDELAKQALATVGAVADDPEGRYRLRARFYEKYGFADVAGLGASYEAYKASLGGKPAPVINGFTGDQRFFLAYAHSWQGKAREGALRSQLLSNPHSPEQYRVNGIVRNMDEWYRAFGVKPGDKLYLPPEERVHVW